jgi:hypothetical protein
MWGLSKIQHKLLAVQREHSALKSLKFIHFLLSEGHVCFPRSTEPFEFGSSPDPNPV